MKQNDLLPGEGATLHSFPGHVFDFFVVENDDGEGGGDRMLVARRR